MHAKGFVRIALFSMVECTIDDGDGLNIDNM